jgi:hypothetical protein
MLVEFDERFKGVRPHSQNRIPLIPCDFNCVGKIFPTCMIQWILIDSRWWSFASLSLRSTSAKVSKTIERYGMKAKQYLLSESTRLNVKAQLPMLICSEFCSNNPKLSRRGQIQSPGGFSLFSLFSVKADDVIVQTQNHRFSSLL